MKTAATSISNAHTPRVMPGSETASRRPATRPAAAIAAFSTQPSATLPAVSCSGGSARGGSTAACAGRVVTIATAAMTAPTYATRGTPRSAAHAATSRPPACARCPTMRSRIGSPDSTARASRGARQAAGTSWASATRPDSVAPPRSKATTRIASQDAYSPRTNTAYDSTTRASRRLPRTSASTDMSAPGSRDDQPGLDHASRDRGRDVAEAGRRLLTELHLDHVLLARGLAVPVLGGCQLPDGIDEAGGAFDLETDSGEGLVVLGCRDQTGLLRGRCPGHGVVGLAATGEHRVVDDEAGAVTQDPPDLCEERPLVRHVHPHEQHHRAVERPIGKRDACDVAEMEMGAIGQTYLL